jgi:hypothetical protein
MAIREFYGINIARHSRTSGIITLVVVWQDLSNKIEKTKANI